MAAVKERFTRTCLETDGFVGWVTFGELDGVLVDDVQAAGGVYVVVREGGVPVSYFDANPAVTSRAAIPPSAQKPLKANWVHDATVVYIGKADNLRRRLREYMRFGLGVPIGHWGGRLIWQLADSTKLLVAWRETPGEVPKLVESQLIEEFRSAYGKPPFANEPHRRGY